MFVELINPETRLCAIVFRTALRSSKYDSKAKSGNGTRLGYSKVINYTVLHPLLIL